MGRKNRNIKSEKKLSAKQKKKLAALGKKDVEEVGSRIEKEEASRQRVTERVIKSPFRRENFSLVAHPYKDELILFGGEFLNGSKTTVYNDLLTYDLNKNVWTVIKAPNAPPPRCSHQAVAVPTNKGEMWVFGGEYASPSESHFYQYKDLWVYRMNVKKWEKITSPGGPSVRSEHRMISMEKRLIVFGGYYENRNYKYLNDVYLFNLETYTWHRIETIGIPPAPRGECVMLPMANKLIIYGGYSEEPVKRNIDKGRIHTDMYSLTPNGNDLNSLQWKWSCIKQTGASISPRYGMSGVIVHSNVAYIFGGVFDIEEDEDTFGTFYNDLMALDLEKFRWYNVRLSGKKNTMVHCEKESAKKEEDTSDENQCNFDKMSTWNQPLKDTHNADASTPTATLESCNDGISTLTVDPAQKSTMQGIVPKTELNTIEDIFTPSPRVRAGLVMKNNILYLYGGTIEDEKRDHTHNDLYSLDCRKLDEWETIIASDLSSDLSSDEWYSDSEDYDEDDDEDNEEDANEDENDECNFSDNSST